MLSSENISLSIISSLKKKKGMTVDELTSNLPQAYLHLDLSPVGIVVRHLLDLNQLGLVDIYKDQTLLKKGETLRKIRWEDHSVKSYISEKAIRIEDIFISSKFKHNKILGDTESIDSYKHDIFVLMPFAKEFKPIYDDHIKKVGEKIHMNVYRADDLFTNKSILGDIWNAINTSAIIIADLTNKNPNVFYEVGLCHALGKEVILIAQTIDDIPSDLRHLRILLYTFTPRGMSEFEVNLKKTLFKILDDQGTEFMQIR